MDLAKDQEAKKPPRAWPWILGALVGLFFFVGFMKSNSPEGRARSSARDAIAACWEMQARKSMAPDVARFAAGACERMEEDYRQTHGTNP